MGLTLLGMTYALFDPDLGTSVPIFHEFTCSRGMHVEAVDGYGNSTINVPAGAVYAKAFGEEGQIVPAFLTLHRRDEGGDWARVLAAENPNGQFVFTLSDVRETTEVYVEARDPTGAYCKASSGILKATTPASARNA